MIIAVKLFARAKDLAGADVVRVDLPEGATVADLRRQLAARWPGLAELLKKSAVAVDGDFAADDVVVRAVAEIAVLPPVSGGQTEK
jgi:molybdopterin converting factor subunit 1